MSRWKIFERLRQPWAVAATLAVIFAIVVAGSAYGYSQHSAYECQHEVAAHEGTTHGLSLQTDQHGGYRLNYSPQPQEHRETCFWNHNAEQWLALLTAWLVLGTVFLAIVTGFLWLETRGGAEKQMRAAALNLRIARRQLSDGMEAHRRELRAYLKTKEVVAIIKAAEFVTINFTLMNYGKTPALKSAAVPNVVMRQEGWLWESETFPTPTEDRPEFVLHPGEDFQVFGRLLVNEKPAILDQGRYDAIIAGKASIYARIVVFYDDAFGYPHESEMRFEFNSDAIATGKPMLGRTGSRAT